MKVLLIGEYSRLHLTLSEGLKKLGHNVTLASDGDGFKNYARDIDLTRKSSRLKDTLECAVSVLKKFSHFEGYDVVQLINPRFTTLNMAINSYLFSRLRKSNLKIFLGAFGEDYFWVKACSEALFKYSEFFVDGKPTDIPYTQILKKIWLGGSLGKANRNMAEQSDGIIACLYEYYMSYSPYFGSKVGYIPLPVNTDLINVNFIEEIPSKIKFFIGINRERSNMKGTDVMEKALERLGTRYPDKVLILRIENVSYEEYQNNMNEAHVVLDQLYSYTPAMNGLLAMAKGKVLVGGGEPEMYDLLSEPDLRPIINVAPNEDNVFNNLEYLVLHPEQIPILSRESRMFVEKHHSYLKVAQQYLNFWTGCLPQSLL